MNVLSDGKETIGGRLFMYQKVEDNQRMTDIEATVHYPDSYIIFRRDSTGSEVGTVLYIGDNMG